MGNNVFLLVVCLSAIVSTGYALQCYHCDSAHMDDCKEGSSLLQKQTCNLELADHLQYCILKIVYDKLELMDKVIAGCELVQPLGNAAKKDPSAPEPLILLDKNVDKCNSDFRYDVKGCQVCRTDYCNSLPNSAIKIAHGNFFLTLCLPLLFIFTKLITA